MGRGLLERGSAEAGPTEARPTRVLPRWARPLLRLVALLVATSVVTFALVGASPVDPVRANVGQASYAHMSAGQREELE